MSVIRFCLSRVPCTCNDVTWKRCKESHQQPVPWCQSKLVSVEGNQLRVFGSAVVKLNIEGESFELSVVVIDPLTSEAILGLDVLNQCIVDLSHKKLITGAGHVVDLYCQGQGQHPEWETNLVDAGECETVNTSISEDQTNLVNAGECEMVNNSTSEDQSLLKQLVDSNLPQEESEDNSDAVHIYQMGESGHVLTVKIIDNVRIPAFSELEILVQVKGDGSHLENNLKNSDLLVARAIVTPGDVVPVRLMNPTGG